MWTNDLGPSLLSGIVTFSEIEFQFIEDIMRKGFDIEIKFDIEKNLFLFVVFFPNNGVSIFFHHPTLDGGIRQIYSNLIGFFYGDNAEKKP